MKTRLKTLLPVLGLGLSTTSLLAAEPYTVVDTGQSHCYDNRGEIAPPKPGQPFDGQDAQYRGVQPSYQDHGDGKLTPEEYRPQRPAGPGGPGGPGMRGEGFRPGGPGGPPPGEGQRPARQRPPSE